MPKKKKKHSKKPSSKKEIKLMRQIDGNGAANITWQFALANSEATFIDNSPPPMYPDKVDKNNLVYGLAEKFREVYKNKVKNPLEIIEKDVDLLHSVFDKYLTALSDMDQTLNKYSHPEPLDSIDLRQYIHENDIFKTMFDIINEKPDVEMLFSPSETFEIKFTDAISYRVRRCVYDPERLGVRYCFVEYRKIMMSDGIIFEAPTVASVIQADIVRVSNKTNVENNKASLPLAVTIDSDSFGTVEKANFDMMCENVENPNDFYAIRIGDLGAKQINNMASWVQNMFDIEKTLRREAYEIILMLYNNQYGAYIPENFDIINHPVELGKNNVAAHVNISKTLPIAAVIIANYYLKQKQISRPVQTEKPYVTHKTEIVLENRPERKTRILGNNIKITTETRPQAITAEKLIKYHTPEWSRKAHLRRLKSGKIIEVKAQTCKRRCIDMPDIIDKRPVTKTDLIIVPETEKKGND